MELLTPKQIERRERNAHVAQVYREMRRKYPTASNGRIIEVMAGNKVAGLTSISGIRSALIERGCITVARP